MAKVAVVLTNMYHDEEFDVPKKAFEQHNHEIVVISGTKEQIKGLYGHTVTPDKTIDEVDAHDFDALFIPGGFSPDQLREDDRFVAFAKKFDYYNRPIFAICHGPQLLITAEILRGRKMTGFKSIQTDLKYAGANVYDEPVVVCSGTLVTSRSPEDLDHFTKRSLDILETCQTTTRV